MIIIGDGNIIIVIDSPTKADMIAKYKVNLIDYHAEMLSVVHHFPEGLRRSK